MYWSLILAAMATPMATGAQGPCDLHLFALDLGVAPTPTGNMLVKPLAASSDPLALINIMSPQDRMSDVSDDDYRRALNMPGDTPVTRHWNVALPGNVRKLQSPLVKAPARCHVELIGYSSTGMMASRSRIGKDEVVIDLIFREFASNAVTPLEVRGGGYGAVDTVKKVGREAALLSLQAASIAIVQDFGKKVAKKRAKAR